MQVCKALQAALKACQPCLTVAVTVNSGKLSMIRDFAYWLRKNAHLVEYLSIQPSAGSDEGACAAAECMVSQAFALAAADGVALGLQKLAASGPVCSPNVLASLSASTITSLSLDMSVSQSAASTLPASIQQLSNLQQLTLEVKKDSPGGQEDEDEVGQPEVQLISPALLAALRGLTNLRSLELRPMNCTWSSLCDLPCSIQRLTILAVGSKSLLDISHMTNLSRLVCICLDGLVEGSRLPPRLPVAVFGSTPLPADAPCLLAGVQQLRLTNVDSNADLLVQLSGLRDLQILELIYCSVESAAASAAAWGNLRQLRELVISEDSSVVGEYRNDCQAVLEGIATAKHVTKLSLTLPGNWDLPCVQYISHLANLQDLSFEQAKSSRQDMLHLRKLTQLTALALTVSSLDDATAAEVLGTLVGLKSLRLEQAQAAQERQLTDAIIPLMKYQLKGLRKLTLCLPGVSDDSVGLLEGLTQLTELRMTLKKESRQHLRRVLGARIRSGV